MEASVKASCAEALAWESSERKHRMCQNKALNGPQKYPGFTPT